MKKTFVTVVEHAYYLKKANKLLTEEQIADVADAVAADPFVGDLIHGTGGFRKFRYAGIQGKGKSGGARVIHFFVSHHKEVHLIDIFEKNEKENLTKAEQNELAKIAALLKGH